MHGLFSSKENTLTGLDVSFSLPTNDIRLTINFSPIKLNNLFDTLYHLNRKSIVRKVFDPIEHRKRKQLSEIARAHSLLKQS